MTPDDWKALDDLFDAARSLPADGWESFAREKCPERLRGELLSLLRADQSDVNLLERPIGSVAPLVIAQSGEDPFLGRRLESYTVVSVIGRGGMGVVYEARQDSPSRTVALKVIKPGAIGPAALKRFQHEAEVLGRLQHQGIAQVYESGWAQTPLGRQPFFALEMVRGLPLLEYIRAKSLSIRARLGLFALVCDAVQHAHTKGVIHRDLKPGNILVDESGQPKILDFGIARLTDSDIRVTTMQTDIGQLIGTVPYMSPEQAAGDPKQLDTRSDVYALGVLLYEVLTGRLPYDLREKPVPEAVRVIADQDPTRLSVISRVFRGDIETIAAKALEKDKARRYQSAAELAADVRRYLSDQAILARPASAAYQLKKFARRNKALVGGVIAAFVLLVAGVIGTSVGMVRARAGETKAKVEARKAVKAIEFLVGMLTSASPEESEGRDVTVKEILDKAAGRVGEELAEEPEVRQTIESAIGRSFDAIGRTGESRVHLELATRLARDVHGVGSVEEGQSLLNEGSLAAHERRWTDTEDLGKRASAIMEAKGALKDRAAAQGLLGFALAAQRKNTAAIPALRESLRLYAQAGMEESDDSVEIMQHLGVTLGRQGGREGLAEGEAILKKSLAIRSAKPSSPKHAAALNALASFYYTQSRSEDARPLFEESLALCTKLYGEKDRRTLEIVSSLGRTHMLLGDLDKAQELALRAVKGFEESGEGETAEAAAAQSRLGTVYERRKDWTRAEECHARALELRRKLGHADVPVSMAALAAVYSETGRDGPALDLLKESVGIERKKGFPRADAGVYLVNLAKMHAKLGQDEEAGLAFKEASGFARERMPEHVQRARLEHDYAGWLIKKGRAKEAEGPARIACEIFRKLKSDRLASALSTLAEALERSGQAEKAAEVKKELGVLETGGRAGASK